MFYTKLTKMPYAQAKVAVFCGDPKNRRCALISYETRVADIIEDGWVIVHGLYSRTTIRHISAFAAEYCNTDYYTLKKCYTENLAYNIYTKEFFNRLTGEVFR
jgi:hypothetical protein